MAVSSSDIKLRVAIESASPDLSGVKQVENELVGMGQAAESAVSKVSAEAGTLADKLSKINAAGGFKDVAADALKAQAATDKLHTSVSAGFGRSNQVLQDMGRIIQDMPYGIMGIGNNIQPLVDSFSRAKAEAGGTGAAVKSVLAGLAGPAGLAMVGIPVVTSLAIAFGDKLVSAIGAGGEALEDFEKKLDAVSGYRNIALDVSVVGMSALDKLEVKLTSIEKRLSLSKQEVTWQERREKLPNEFLSRAQDVLNGALYGNLATKSQGTAGRDALDRERKAVYAGYGREIATGVAAAQKGDYSKLVSYGNNNKDFLQEAGYSASVAIALTSQLKILAVKAETLAEKHNELGKSHDKLIKEGESASEKAEAQRLTESDRISKANEKAIAWYGKTTEATKGLYDAQGKMAEAYENASVLVSIGAITNVQAADALGSALIDNRDDLFGLGKATRDATKGVATLSDKFAAVGTLAGLVGVDSSGVAGLLSGIDSLSSENISKLATEKYGGDTEKAQASVYAGIAQSLGQVVGGKAGSAISGAASGALAGSMIAPGIGTIIGGVIGLSGSLFGGDSAAKQARNDARRAGYNDILSSALSGGAYSSQLARGGGYTYDSMANWYTATGDRTGRLFNDRAEAGMAGLTAYVKVMDASLASVAALAKPSIVSTIAQIQTKYEYSIATVGRLAELEQARISDLTVALTGLSVDSLTSTFESVITSTSPEAAGKAMADKVMEGLAASIRQMQVATFMESVITPVLQPLYASLVENMVAGNGTAGDFSAINAALVQLTPTLTAFAQSLSAQGIAGNKAVDTTNALTDALGNFTASTSSFKMLLQQQYDNAKRIVDLQKSAYEDTVSKITSLRSSLDATLSSINGQTETLQTRRSAQADIAVAALLARTTGQLPLDGKLSDSLGVVAKPASSLYGSALDYARDMARTVADISALNDVAGTQLTDSQLQINWLEKISGTLDRSYDNSVTAYDQYVIAAKAQIDGLNGIGLSATVTNKSLADQTAAAQSALQEQVSGFSGMIGGIGAVETGVGSVENVMSTIELNQATYDAALKQVAGIYDVNASVSAVNFSVNAMNGSVSKYLGIQEQDKALKEAAAAKQANDAAKASAAAAAAASKLAFERKNAVQINGSSILSEGAVNVAKGSLSSIQALNNAYKVYLYADPNQRTARGYWSPTTGFSTATSEMRYGNLSGVESVLVERIPGFATGGYHAGGARLVGEVGPELEITGPSRIISNRDTKAIFDVQALLDALETVRQEIAELRGEQIIGNSRIIINTRATANAVDLANNLAGVTG